MITKCIDSLGLVGRTDGRGGAIAAGGGGGRSRLHRKRADKTAAAAAADVGASFHVKPGDVRHRIGEMDPSPRPGPWVLNKFEITGLEPETIMGLWVA